VDEPGILAPIRVGDWTFEGMVPCWEPLIAPGVCEAREAGPFSRRLALAQGSNVAAGQRGDGLDLNGYWDLDEFDPRYHTLATDEYGWSQTNTGAPEAPSWQDGPMARTDQSITVSAWVKVDTDVAASQAVWSLCGVHECALWLKYHSTTGVWRAVLMDEDVSGSPFATTDSVSQVVDDEWTHLVVSYDAGADRLRLYVNGVLESTRQVSYRAFNAAGPLYLGRTTYRSNVIDHLSGTVDDANVFQGAMTDAQAKQLYDEQLVEDLQP
jgi:hypothetical protein